MTWALPQHCSFEQPFIDGLSRFRNLRHLSLGNSVSNLAPTWKVIWEQLRNLKSITELCIHNFHPLTGTDYSKLMNNLILNLTLKKLALELYYFDETLLNDLAKLNNLQTLQLRLCLTKYNAENGNPFSSSVDWQPLKRLNQIKDLNLYTNTAEILINFLNNLGCCDSLQQLKIGAYFGYSDEISEAIKRFPNIKKLIIDENQIFRCHFSFIERPKKKYR